MTDTPTRRQVVAAERRFPWLALGVVLLLVANGRWIFPLASWTFAVGWLVFLDRSRYSGLALAFLAYVLVHFVIWQGIIPAPGVLYYLIAATYAAVYFLPFVAHRLWASRAGAFRATLVFPLTWVSAEFVFSRWLTPYGSWASLAYTQSEYLPVLQLASVAGIAGIVFLMTWFAAVLAWMLRPGLDGRDRLSAATALAAALVAVLVFGQLRLMNERHVQTVRAAALVPSAEALGELEELLRPVRRGEAISEAALGRIEASATRLNDDLFERTRREARAGAKLIAWSETAARVFASAEEAFIERASRLAAEEGVVLFLALGVWHPDAAPPFENKVVAIGADGVVAWEYQKAHPIIGAESSFIAAGAGSVKRLDASFGNLSAVICHDLDFPHLLKQTSGENIGLVVAPSDDWSNIAVIHARMAVVRAVENGFTLLRPTNGGRSIAIDPRGRVLARLDFPEDALIANVSASRSPTIYGMVGDLFSWLSLIVLPVLVVSLSRTRRADAPSVDPVPSTAEVV